VTRPVSLILGIVVVTGAWITTSRFPQAPRRPEEAVAELLAADRGFAGAAAHTDVAGALAPMLAPEVVFGPVPGGRFAQGRDQALAAVQANPDNLGGRLEWAPIRGGVSADGQHGFTFGYMTLIKADGARVPIKYMAYWIRQTGGWRAAVYKRARRPAGEVTLAMMPPSLPDHLVPVTTDAASIARHLESLDQAERAFSQEAQQVGLGAAFAKWGSADAVNMGGPDAPAFVVGARAIGGEIGAGSPGTSSPVSWAPDRVIVASSGDLGVTIGFIRPNQPSAGGSQATGTPFFTIWRRAGPGAPWRYVAE